MELYDTDFCCMELYDKHFRCMEVNPRYRTHFAMVFDDFVQTMCDVYYPFDKTNNT